MRGKKRYTNIVKAEKASIAVEWVWMQFTEFKLKAEWVFCWRDLKGRLAIWCISISCFTNGNPSEFVGNHNWNHMISNYSKLEFCLHEVYNLLFLLSVLHNIGIVILAPILWKYRQVPVCSRIFIFYPPTAFSFHASAALVLWFSFCIFSSLPVRIDSYPNLLPYSFPSHHPPKFFPFIVCSSLMNATTAPQLFSKLPYQVDRRRSH